MNRSKTLLNIALLSSVLTTWNALAEGAKEKLAESLFATIWPSACNEMTKSIFNEPSIAFLNGGGSVNTDKVCSCITARLKSNLIIAPIFRDSVNDGLKRMQDPKFKFYLRAKGFSYTLQCASYAVDESADKFLPGKLPEPKLLAQ